MREKGKKRRGFGQRDSFMSSFFSFIFIFRFLINLFIYSFTPVSATPNHTNQRVDSRLAFIRTYQHIHQASPPSRHSYYFNNIIKVMFSFFFYVRCLRCITIIFFSFRLREDSLFIFRARWTVSH